LSGAPRSSAWPINPATIALVRLRQASIAEVALSGTGCVRRARRFHDLRHFFVTQLFRRGGSAPAVQALAGHLHLATTQIYAHMVQADLRETIHLLARPSST